jgi:hypothetical protein
VVAAVAVYVLTRGSAVPGQSPEFGADVGVLFQNHYPPMVVDRALAGAAQAGLGLARVAPLWELTEPLAPMGGTHRYDWRYDDFIARELTRHGLRWVAVLAFAPGWASVEPGMLHAAPRGAADYAAYAAAVARRYPGLIAAFEIWNEEDLPVFWRPSPDPMAYARLYAAARRAIHSVDPGASVLIGGLAGGHRGFLAQVLRQTDVQAGVDGVAIHAYATTPATMLGQVRAYRLRLRKLGFGAVPLYVTEYGWSSRPALAAPGGVHFPPRTYYAPASVRPEFIVQGARDVLGSGCDVRMAVFYAWLTPQRNLGPYQWYGVAAPDGSSTAATRGIAAQVGLTRARAAAAGSCSP